MIIGIHGKIKCGKTTISKKICNEFGDFKFRETRSFSFYLKRVINDMFSINLFVEENKVNKTNILWENLPHWEPGMPTGLMTGREFMQQFATEICRNIDKECWIRPALSNLKFKEDSGLYLIVFEDVRFLNEAEALKKMGGKIIKLNNDGLYSDHVSEKEMVNFKFDFELPKTKDADEALKILSKEFN